MSSSDLNVLYEDNHLIAVLKPAGVLVQGDESGDESLMDVVKTYLKEKYKKPGNVFLGLIHRLDRNVSGVVLFAKTSKGASRISEQFRNHTTEKIYHARVIGIPSPTKGTLKNYLRKDERIMKAEVFDKPMQGADEATLYYEVIAQEIADKGQDIAVMKITLGTGRFHQIRAQMAHLGHPIVGDVKYGATEAFADQHIELCATSLSFNVATGDERKTVIVPFV